MQEVLFSQHIQVYKSFPFHPSNGTFDPRLSFNRQDMDFLVENGFNIVRLYVAWQGVEFSEGQYNMTYLQVSTVDPRLSEPQLSKPSIIRTAN